MITPVHNSPVLTSQKTPTVEQVTCGGLPINGEKLLSPAVLATQLLLQTDSLDEDDSPRANTRSYYPPATPVTGDCAIRPQYVPLLTVAMFSGEMWLRAMAIQR